MFSKHPRYRRNIQYLFSCSNDATMRQINGGFYQTLNLRNPNEKFTKEIYLIKLKIWNLMKEKIKCIMFFTESETQNNFGRNPFVI